MPLKNLSWFGGLLLAGLPSAAAVPAFPGAEGFGAGTPGGRGGKVIVVSNLADAGLGSLRAACEAAGPRVVVFAVAGIIDLKSPLVVREPFLTIAGQTAPGEGVCLRVHEFKIQTHDVIVRFLRCRPGPSSHTDTDAISIGGDSDGPQYYNAIFDHCSAQWSVDECLSPSGPIYNITVQWCLIGEPLNNSVHHKGRHAYGSLVHGIGGITLHHNLWLDCDERSPRLGDNFFRPPWPTFDVRNNVMYNWGKFCSGLTGDNLSANYVGNYLRPGPQSSSTPPIVLTKTAQVKYYVTDNVVEGRPQYARDPAAMFSLAQDRSGMNPKAKTAPAGQKPFTLVPQPFATPAVRTEPAAQAYRRVLAEAGAVAPQRDAVDQRLVQQVVTNTGRIIDSPDEVGGWPKYRPAVPPADGDHDGMPDAWETAHGLDPRNPRDAAATAGNGYTHIENYINELADAAIARSRASPPVALP